MPAHAVKASCIQQKKISERKRKRERERVRERETEGESEREREGGRD